MSKRGRTSSGFTLVELMVVVAIVGVLAALATFGVRKYISLAKAAEARNNLGRMAKDASSSFQRGYMTGTILTEKQSVKDESRLCVSASAGVPASPASIKGQKYQSSQSEWGADAATPGKGFACLKFTLSDPQYYMYRYTTTTTNFVDSGKLGTQFDAIAQGDLNGDGVLSTFTMSGKIQTSGTGLELMLAPSIDEKLADE